MESLLTSNRPDHGALLLMALVVLIWGATWVVLKFLAPQIGPFDLVVLRYGIGFLVLLVLLIASRQSLRCPPFWLTLGIGFFQTAAFSCLSQFALLTGGAGHVVMLAYTMPFWVLGLAWFFLQERPTRRQGLGCVLAGLGLVAVIAPWQGLGGIVSSLLAVASGISWAIATILSKLMFQRHSPNVLALATWQMFLGALLTVPFAALQPQPFIHWQPELILGIAFLGVVSSAAGWGLWLLVVRRVSATAAGMSSLAVPVLTIFLAWILLGERPTTLELAGITLMMAGLTVVSLSPVVQKPVSRSA